MLGVATLAAVLFTAVGLADPFGGGNVTHVSNIAGQPNTNTKSPQVARPNVLPHELQQIEWARGSFQLENPTPLITYYGYDSDVKNVEGDAAMLPALTAAPPANVAEATKTEPDKNTYLRLDGQKGPDPSYDYGTHFLFQGHEGGPGYLTRVNLDADGKHRVTLMASTMDESRGTPQPLPGRFDGSTYDPFAKRILGTFEAGNAGGVVQFTPDYPSHAEDLYNSMGRGGYEGIQDDSAGNLYIVEDVGGSLTGARRAPSSFVYRFIPTRPGNLEHGKLQALRVYNKAGAPITAQSQSAPGNPDQNELHSYGNTLKTEWITIHDTEGTPPNPAGFDANALAKAAQATSFKRPENGVFQPETKFRNFFFDETGDTNALSTDNDPPATAAQAPGLPAGSTIPAATGSGGWATAQKLTQSPTSNFGTIQVFYKGDIEHAGFDNVQFLTQNKVTFVEDAGDTLHTQRKKLDSGYIFDTNVDYSKGAQPVRWLAEGRDASATIDSFLADAKAPGFKNDGDNEITGVHVSDGDPSVAGILGVKVPQALQGPWRWFWTQQHGDNVTFEVIPSPANAHDGKSEHGDNYEGGDK